MPHRQRAQRGRKFVEAYQNNEVEVEVIPSNTDIYGEDSAGRQELVGAYCRVSTMSDEQVESYELQKAYYEEMVLRQPSWTLVGIYPDEGISGTSMKKRRNFLRMIEDCKSEKITLIVTKSISRFARNVVDAISTVRMLRNLPQPVAVWFETEQINTMRPGADSMLSLLASFAESESLIKSTSMKWAIRNRFKHGIPRIVDTYGFLRSQTELVPNEEGPIPEACVVKSMYASLLEGKTLSEIQRYLHENNIPSPRGQEWWSIATILYVLSNEKYAGDVLMQKTVCIDMFSHKSVKNRGHERQYRIQEHHTPIIPKDEWIRAQRLLNVTDLSLFLVGEPDFIGFGDEKMSFTMLAANHENNLTRSSYADLNENEDNTNLNRKDAEVNDHGPKK